MSEIKKPSILLYQPNTYFNVTVVLVVLCLFVASFSKFGVKPALVQPLLFASRYSNGLTEILHGQVWRLITPIFVHFGWLHFILNMSGAWTLGNMMEVGKGSRFTLLFVVVVGVVSNFVQYQFTHAGNFGGVSGVLYGMFGYIWIQGRYNLAFDFILNEYAVAITLLVYLITFTGIFGNAGNSGHTAGLIMGIAWGYIHITYWATPSNESTSDQALEKEN